VDRSTVVSRRSVLQAFTAVAAAPMAATSALAESPRQRIGRQAPMWEIVEWINRDGGNIDTLRGSVIIIDFFQLWCPGCNKFSGPLMTHWQKKYSRAIADRKLSLVKIHTVFEGHNYQTVRRLRRYVKEKNITIPVGVDRHVGNSRIPETMRRYRTRGTPEMAIIDSKGIIRFQQFGYFPPEEVEPLITALTEKTRA